jgi:hypothetical protein
LVRGARGVIGDRVRIARATEADAGAHEVANQEADGQREGRDDLEIDGALTPTRPTLRASWMCEMPDTTVQKMIGAIAILISLMKPVAQRLHMIGQSNCGNPYGAPPSLSSRLSAAFSNVSRNFRDTGRASKSCRWPSTLDSNSCSRWQSPRRRLQQRHSRSRLRSPSGRRGEHFERRPEHGDE